MNEFFNVKRMQDETDFEFLLRVCMAKHNKEIDADWTEIVEAFNLGCHCDTLRKKFCGPFAVHHVVKYYEEKIYQLLQDNKTAPEKELDNKIKQLQLEKQKVKDQRTELNRLMRTQARWEQLMEIIDEKVTSYEPVTLNKISKNNKQNAEACLLLSDWHIGSSFDTYIEKFNIDIAKESISRLKQCTIDYCLLHNVETLYIEILGDMVSGIIHIGNRLAQTENIVQQNIMASELLAELIYELSKVVPNIKLIYCVGNHGRVNADIKESISEENFEYFIKYYLETKLKNLENIEWLENEINHEMCFYTLDNGKTIAALHGHREKRQSYKDAVKNLSDYSETYRVDEVHMGHFHNHQVINNVLINGSLMGSDEYAQNFKYHAKPSQTLRVYDSNGNTITYEIILR